MKSNYTHKRLKKLEISPHENKNKSFKTFQPYYYQLLNREFNGVASAKMDKHHRYQQYRESIGEDNILIRYSDAFGDKLLEQTKGYPKPVERLRFHPEHLPTNSEGKAIRYKSAKNSKLYGFYNGLYTYFIKPLEKEGLIKDKIIEKLKPTFHKITIVEGEFKAFAGCKVGIPSIGVSGIHNAVKTIKETVIINGREQDVTIDGEFLKDIARFIKTFEVQEIDFLFDSDCFDNVENSSRARSFFGAIRNFRFACIAANVRMNFRYIKADAVGKGLDDLIENNASLEDSIVTIPIHNQADLEKLEFSFATSVKDIPFFFSNDYETKRAKEGQKLSKVISTNWILDSIAVAPTGSGKTFLITTHNNWKIIACPTISLVDGVVEEYNAIKFEGKKVRQFQKIFRQFAAIDLICTIAGGTPAKFIAVTYDSLQLLSDNLNALYLTNQFDLFVDEGHNYTTATSYRLKALTNVLNVSKYYNSQTLLTGTYLPTFHPSIAPMPIREVISPKRRIDATLYECKNTLKAVAYLMEKSISNGRFPLVLLNDKKMDRKLGTVLGFLKKYKIAAFNSDTKNNKDWQKITSKGHIQEGYQGMIVTTVLKEGNNIYNNYDYDIITIGNFHSVELAQFVARARNPKSVNLSIIKSDSRKKYDGERTIYKTATDLLYTAMNSGFELNTKDIDGELLFREFLARNYISRLPLYFDGDKCKIDYLALSNFAFQFDTMQENSNDGLLRNRLVKYNIHLNQIETLTEDTDKDEKQAAKEGREAVKAEKEKEFEELIAKLKYKEVFTYSNQMLTYSANQLSPVEKTTFKKIQSIKDFITDKAVIMEMLEDARLSEARFKLLKKQYIIQSLRNSKEYEQAQRKFWFVMDTIYTKFPIGKEITASEAKELLLECLRIDEGLNLDKYQKGNDKVTNKNAISTLKLFFEVEGIRRTKGFKYVLGCIKWTNFISNIVHLIHLEPILNKHGYPAFWD